MCILLPFGTFINACTEIASSLSRRFLNYDFLHDIALFDLVDDIQPVIDFSKHRVLAIEVARVVATVTNKEL